MLLCAGALSVPVAVQGAPLIAHSVTFSNAKGTTHVCGGIAPLVNKCVQMMEESGLIRTGDVGTTGLTFGIAGQEDGAITYVVTDGAGWRAGLRVGDRIETINGKPSKPTAGMIAAERIFGVSRAAVNVRVRRGWKLLEFNLVRSSQKLARGLKSGTMLIAVRPVMNWKGQSIPCMGAGPGGIAAIDDCQKTFARDGYIKADDVGTTGIQLDLNRADAAVITGVDPESAAARAGIMAGDEIVQVNQLPLGESVGGILPELLFGKAGDSLTLTVQAGSGTRTVRLVLGAKPTE